MIREKGTSPQKELAPFICPSNKLFLEKNQNQIA